MDNQRKMIHCKFCNKLDRNYSGYCQKCYSYFVKLGYKIFESEYGKVCKVTDKQDPQYGMIICHICGRAYTKLQSHIYYTHNLSKKEYCKQFGLDNKVKLTENNYSQKMSKNAYDNDMDKQVVRVGMKTRFKQGRDNHYERSYMTKERLIKYGKEMGYKNLKKFKEK